MDEKYEHEFLKELMEKVDEYKMSKLPKPDDIPKMPDSLMDGYFLDFITDNKNYKVHLKLRWLRAKLKCSKIEIGLRAGIDPFEYSQYEMGKESPSPENIRKLAEVFGVTPEYIADDKIEVDYDEELD